MISFELIYVFEYLNDDEYDEYNVILVVIPTLELAIEMLIKLSVQLKFNLRSQHYIQSNSWSQWIMSMI